MPNMNSTEPTAYPDFVEVTTQPATEWRGEFAVVEATLPSGRTTRIDVYGRGSYGTAGEPGVNWAGIGSVTVADARAFAEALTFAADLSDQLAGPVA